MVLAIMFIPRSRIPWEESFSEQIFPFNGLQVRELFRVRENHLNSIEFFLLIAQRARQVCSIANTPWSLANSSAQGDVCAPAYLSTARDTTKSDVLQPSSLTGIITLRISFVEAFPRVRSLIRNVSEFAKVTIPSVFVALTASTMLQIMARTSSLHIAITILSKKKWSCALRHSLYWFCASMAATAAANRLSISRAAFGEGNSP